MLDPTTPPVSALAVDVAIVPSGETVGASAAVAQLDAAVVVEQHRARDLLVLGQRLHRAERHLHAGAARLDRAEQHRERDRERDRGDQQEQRERIAQREPARRSRRTRRQSTSTGLRRCARPERTVARAGRRCRSVAGSASVLARGRVGVVVSTPDRDGASRRHERLDTRRSGRRRGATRRPASHDRERKCNGVHKNNTSRAATFTKRNINRRVRLHVHKNDTSQSTDRQACAG